MDPVTTLIYSATWLAGVAITYAIFCFYVACMRWRCWHSSDLSKLSLDLSTKHTIILIDIMSITKAIITRGSSLDRDLEGFPLNQVEVDQRGQDERAVDGVVEDGLHDHVTLECVGAPSMSLHIGDIDN